MEEVKVGRGILTTNHAASSYGKPVFVLDGEAYGPEDMLDGFMIGSHLVTALAGFRTVTDEQMDEARRFVSQSPTHGERWSAMLAGLAEVEPSLFPDEG